MKKIAFILSLFFLLLSGILLAQNPSPISSQGEGNFDNIRRNLPEKRIRQACDQPEITYLSDLAWADTTNGWGPVERDQSNGEQAPNDGVPLNINGVVFEKGFGVHASDTTEPNAPNDDISRITFNLGGEYDYFLAFVGPQFDKANNGICEDFLSIQFEVHVDGEVAFRSPVMFYDADAIPVEVDVQGKNVLELIILDGGQGDGGNTNRCDHGVWGDAKLEKCTTSDLRISNLDIDENPVLPGEVRTLTFDVANIGDIASGFFSLNLDLGGRVLTPSQNSFSPISPNGIENPQSVTVTIPSVLAPGTYLLTAVISATNDGNTSNNTDTITVVVSETPEPDLSPTQLAAIPNPGIVGSKLDLNFEVRNSGDANSGSFSIDVVLSPVDVGGGNRNLIPTSNSFAGVNSGGLGSYTASVDLPEDLLPGTYDLTLEVNLAEDNNLTNNARTIRLTINPANTPAPDLTIPELSLSQNTVFPEDDLTVNFTVNNKGDGAAGNFTYIIKIGGITVDSMLSSSGVGVGETLPLIQSAVQVPEALGPGTYSVQVSLVLADDKDNSDNSDAVTLSIVNRPPVEIEITDENFPRLHIMGEDSISSVSVTLNRTDQVSEVKFFYRPISSPDGNFQEMTTSQDGNVFTATFSDTQVGPIGIQYYFDILIASGGTIRSLTGHTHLQFNEGLDLPTLRIGSNVENYQILSVPLQLDSRGFDAVFRDELEDDEGNTRWRFMRFANGRTTDFRGNIETGQGYWFLTPNRFSLNSGAGQTVPVTETSPFRLSISSGTIVNTQIGNPYNFTLSWPDILEANGNPPGIKLKTYNGGWREISQLDPFQGAFIQNNTSENSLLIPVARNPAVNRLQERVLSTPLDGESWFLPIHLQSGELVHQVSGVGMHPDASVGYDIRDMGGLPRWGSYMDLNFPEPGHSFERISENFVDTREQHTWDMELNSNLDRKIIIHWDNQHFGDNAYQLWMEDLQTGRLIDMRLKKSYEVSPNAQRNLFRIHFGDLTYVQEQVSSLKPWVDVPYPNPFQDRLLISFFIPEDSGSSTVRFSLFNLLGKKVAENSWEVQNQKQHKLLKWNSPLTHLPEGVYVYQILLDSPSGCHNIGGRIIHKK